MKATKWKEKAFEKAFPERAVRVMEANQYDAYEGSGQAIAFDPETQEYLVAEYGHCSCDGPEETMKMFSRYDTLIDAVRGVTSYYRKDLLKQFEEEVG